MNRLPRWVLTESAYIVFGVGYIVIVSWSKNVEVLTKW